MSKSPVKPSTNGMTPVYLEPKEEPYLVHHLENSQHSSCASNSTDNAGTHSSTIGGSPSLNLHLSTKNEPSAKMEESTTTTTTSSMKNEGNLHLTARSNLSNPELTNMQPAPPSYNPYSPMYNAVGV